MQVKGNYSIVVDMLINELDQQFLDYEECPWHCVSTILDVT